MRAVVVGGGIAGPATALALREVGIDAVVLEAGGADRAARGSWFTLAPNGVAALAELGVLDEVRSLGVPTRTNIMVGATGRELGRLSLGAPLDDGTPPLSFRRPQLATALAAAAAARGIEVHEDARVVRVDTAAERAEVELADGERIAADLVVGADGIGSTVRRAIDPAAPAARYLGLANFGGVTPSAAVPDAAAGLPPEAWWFVFGRHAFFGALPTPAGDVVWFVNQPRARVSREERAETGDATWLERLAELAAPDAGPFAELISAGRLELAGDSTHDLPRVPHWHRDRLVLVGDAIHAPAPSSGQGASMALEDAIALARSLRGADAGIPALSTSFAAYESARRSRVERIVRDGARSSSTKTAGPVGRIVQDAMLGFVFRRVVTDASREWIWGHRERLAG